MEVNELSKSVFITVFLWDPSSISVSVVVSVRWNEYKKLMSRFGESRTQSFGHRESLKMKTWIYTKPIIKQLKLIQHTKHMELMFQQTNKKWSYISDALENSINRFKSSLSSSSSSCRAASTDIPDPLSPLLPIVHRLWQVFSATSRILT